jgi:hypothetical protein
MSAAPQAPATTAASSGADQMPPVSLVCRAVSWTAIDPTANSTTAYAMENELKGATNYFDPKTTQLTGQITPDDPDGTFTFGITLMLQSPLKL